MIKEVEAYLTEKGYTRYEVPFKWPYIFKGHFQKRVKSYRECETNGRPAIDIEIHRFHYDQDFRFDISLTAEHDNDWWSFKVYGLAFETLIEKLEHFEPILVNLFNQI